MFGSVPPSVSTAQVDSSVQSRQDITFYYEKRRSIASGIVETAVTTFLLLVGVRYYDAGPNAKAMLASGNSFGFLLSPLVVFLVGRSRISVSTAGGYLLWGGAIGFLVAALVPVEEFFVLGSFLGAASTSAALPLYTQIYQDNYPAHLRGRLYSRTAVIRIFSGGVFAVLAGLLLSGRIEYFPLLMLTFAGAMVLSGSCFRRIPSRALHSHLSFGLTRGFSIMASDRVFRITLISWFIMGFASFMMRSLRVEYLADPRYGLSLTEWQVAALVGVIPGLAQLSMSTVWGHFFDRVNFFTLRIAVNLSFVIGILSFFFSDSLLGLVFGAVIYGMANAGGDVAWNLWVTKFAPPDRVALYMGVHTFLTGVRGLISPLLGFHLVGSFGIGSLAWICAGMILGASVMLVQNRDVKSGPRDTGEP